MRCDELQQLLIAQVFSGHELFVGWLICPQDLLRSQSGLFQQLLQLFCGQTLFKIVDALERDTFFSQDTLDLAACASGRLLVNNYFGLVLHLGCKDHWPCQWPRPADSILQGADHVETLRFQAATSRTAAFG